MSAIDEKLRAHRVTVDGTLVPLESSSTRHRRRRIVHRALATADAAGLTIAFAVSFALQATSATADVRPGLEVALFAISVPLWIAAFMIKGLYDNSEDIGSSMIDDAAGAFVVMTVGIWLLYLVDSITGVSFLGIPRLSAFWLVAFVAIPVCRALARRWARSNVAYLQNVIVVGTGPVGRLFARKILAHPEYGLHLVGFVDADPPPGLTHVGSVPVLGTNADLGELVDALAIDRVVVSFTSDSPEETMALIRSIRDQSIQIDIVPRLFEIIGSSSTMQMIGGAPLVALPRLRLARSSRFLKRLFDLSLAVPALVLAAPLLVGVAIAIKIDSRGPVLFRQIRRGEDESTFTILKFRSMTEDAEATKEAVAHLNLHADDDPRMFKVAGDPRITRVGAFLRRSSIDEIPQLLNVIRGDMSLVGPRPLILAEDKHVVDWARKRLSIKPGITGLWQVLGRSDIPFDEMTKLDYLYVTNWSLREDVRLILMTIPSLFRSRAAY